MNQREPHRIARTAALASLSSAILLTGIKTILASMTGSVGVLAEAFHSLADLFAAGMTALAIRKAAAPPDEDHPYGHAKFENVSSLAESLLLGLTGIYVLWGSLNSIVHPRLVQEVRVGQIGLVICLVVALVTGLYVRRAGHEIRSPALIVNGLHLLSDSVGIVAVLAGLFGVEFLHIQAADGYAGLVISMWLMTAAYKAGRSSFDELVDRALPAPELQSIANLVLSKPGVISFHRLRTRSSGAWKSIDVHVVVPNTWSVVQGHDLADSLEKELRARYAPAYVVVHIDPFDSTKVKPKLD